MGQQNGAVEQVDPDHAAIKTAGDADSTSRAGAAGEYAGGYGLAAASGAGRPATTSSPTTWAAPASPFDALYTSGLGSGKLVTEKKVALKPVKPGDKATYGKLKTQRRSHETKMKMINYLNKHVSTLLNDVPFKDWPVERHAESDLDEIRVYYLFKERDLEILCDQDEKIRVVFLNAEECDCVRLSDIPFNYTKMQVQEHLGKPSKSGGKIFDPILGEYGAWDLFSFSRHTIHVEYRTDSDSIRRITLMRTDAVP